MSQIAPTQSSGAAAFFRCPVQAEHNQALIRVGRRSSKAEVTETSIDGFTVTVAAKFAKRLNVGRPWVLEYDGTRTEVHPQWIFNSPDGAMQLGLRRLRDLTRPPKIQSGSILGRIGGKRYEQPGHTAVAFGGFVLFLFSLMSLPGLGDRLGTAPRIQGAMQWVVHELNLTIGNYL